MGEFAKEFEGTLREVVESWKGSLVHIGGPGIPYRTGIVVKEGLAASLARSARDGEEVPVVTASGPATGRVEAWDGESGLVLIRIGDGAAPVPAGAGTEGLDAPRVGTPVLRLAYPSFQGVEAAFSVVRFSGGSTEWGRRKVSAHFQVDGPAYPGFLGAPVVDLAGTLRGVVISNEDGNDGWVLPARPWRVAVDELAKEGTRIRGWLGISIGTVRLSKAQSSSAGRETALMVRETAPGGPAEAAGVQPGDLILGADGAGLGDDGIPPLRVGRPVILDILRGSERLALQVLPSPRS